MSEKETFEQQYEKILKELDVMNRGVYDPSDAAQAAALCLLAQASLLSKQAAADFRARSLKRDIEFKKSEVYFQARQNAEGKVTEASITQKVVGNSEVHQAYDDWNQAEREAKELTNIFNILKEAHIMFRGFSKKE